MNVVVIGALAAFRSAPIEWLLEYVLVSPTSTGQVPLEIMVPVFISYQVEIPVNSDPPIIIDSSTFDKQSEAAKAEANLEEEVAAPLEGEGVVVFMRGTS